MLELGEGGQHVPQEAALCAESQLGLMDESHIDASFLGLIDEHDGVTDELSR